MVAIMALRKIQSEQGMVSLSVLIILGVFAMVSVYFYDIMQINMSNLYNLKIRLELQNIMYAQNNLQLQKYLNDKDLWQQHKQEATQKYEYYQAIKINEATISSELGEIKSKVLLMRYHDNVYILITEVSLQEVHGQISTHLIDNLKEGTVSVHRMER